MNRLSATQIKALDEINRDRAANNMMLDVAMTSFKNAENEYIKRDKTIWIEILDQFDLPKDVTHMTKHIDGVVCVVEKEDV